MSWKHLGETFDIHGGGIDLVFPHHENEIAQTRCAFGHEVMANYWMHNGFLQVEGEKMSKSLGNFVTIHELLHTENFGGRKWPGEVLRLAMLRTHYRQPIDLTVKALEEAEASLRKWSAQARRGASSAAERPAMCLNALADDLNTPLALASLHELRCGDALDGALQGCSAIDVPRLSALGGGRGEGGRGSRTQVAALIATRLAARAAKNWAESDRIRDELAAMGVALKDNKDGTTTWEVKR